MTQVESRAQHPAGPGVGGEVAAHRRVLARSGLTAVVVVGIAAALAIVVVSGRVSPEPAAAPPVSTPLGSCGTEDVKVPEKVPTAVGDAPTVQPSPAPPRSVQIPVLGVDAEVLPVAIDAEGRLSPPSDPSKVGWWSAGAQPGSERGTVLLTSHAVRQGDGVFDNLGRLRTGDRVDVKTANGTVEYEVTANDEISKEEVAKRAAEIFSQEVPARLVLVTCSGWSVGAYRSNTVVVAHP